MSNLEQDLLNQLSVPLRNELLSDKITDRVLTLIRQQHLKPGDKLPAERELAAMMGVSRASIREAMRSLATMNVVEMRHGSGTYITSLEPDLLVERLDLVFLLNDATFFSLIEARKVVEPSTAAFAAQRISEEEIHEIETIMTMSRGCLNNDPIAQFPELDILFHTKIAEFSRNTLLSRFMQAVTRLGIAGSQRTAASGRLEGVLKAIEAHQRILDALKAHDSAAASARMLEHLSEVETRFRMLVEQQSGQSPD